MLRFTWMTVLASLAVLGCDVSANLGTNDAGEADGGSDAGSDGGIGTDAGMDAGMDAGADAGWDAGQQNISIFVVGDLTPKTFTDGLSGQTPSAQEFGVGRLDLMTGPGDPSPVTVFDHGTAPVLVDMLSTQPTLAGQGASAAIPAGTYPWGRVALNLVRTTVATTAHAAGNAVPADVTIVSALGDTLVGGVAWAKGRTEYHVKVGTTIDTTFPGTAPPLPATSGGMVVQDATHTWLVFPFSTPFVIDPTDSTPQVATITYEVFQSFRWEEQASPGFTGGVFDLDVATMSTEPVRNFGTTGYHTTPDGTDLDRRAPRGSVRLRLAVHGRRRP